MHHFRENSENQKKKMEKVQKLIDFEGLVQEIDEEKITPAENWPAQGKINFN